MLHPEQTYVFHHAIDIGAELRLIPHKRRTESCEEKLDLLKKNSRFERWTLDRIIKALYFSRGEEPLIGIITPKFENKTQTKKVLRDVFKLDVVQPDKYQVNKGKTPKGMTWGTCSPFPFASTVGDEREISDLIVYDHPPINSRFVDISIGGQKEGKLVSMHLPYKAIYQILVKEFGHKRVHLYDPSI